MDAGVETIDDKTLAGKLREKAAAVHKRALLVAAAITVVVLVFPDFHP
jgi:Opacity-associated protein A N-terminal motif